MRAPPGHANPDALLPVRRRCAHAHRLPLRRTHSVPKAVSASFTSMHLCPAIRVCSLTAAQQTHMPRPTLERATPPRARRHTTRFVLVYIVFLPLALWRHLDYFTIAVAPLIAFLLAGIENIGVQIENPMRILPMAAYCATIQSNVMLVGGDWAAGNFVRPCPHFAHDARAGGSIVV